MATNPHFEPNHEFTALEGAKARRRSLEVRAEIAKGRKRRWLDCYRETFSIEAACKFAGIGRQAFYVWRRRDPAFAEELEDINEGGVFEARTTLLAAVQAGDVRAAMYLDSQLERRKSMATGALTTDELLLKQRQLWGELANFVPALPAEAEKVESDAGTGKDG